MHVVAQQNKSSTFEISSKNQILATRSRMLLGRRTGRQLGSIRESSSSLTPCPLLGRDIKVFARRQRSQHSDAHHKRCYFSIYIDNGHSYLLFQT
jgi:hypothetical protein